MERISSKENCYAAGVFRKYEGRLSPDMPHVALVCPSDMGNLGTILRTLRGFGIRDLALVGNGADVWNPKVVRASMGALFRMEVESFPEFSDYLNRFGEGRSLYPFMLDGGTVLTPESCPRADRYTLFSATRPPAFPRNSRTAVRACLSTRPTRWIPWNLAVSVAIGSYLFTQKNGRPGQAESK